MELNGLSISHLESFQLSLIHHFTVVTLEVIQVIMGFTLKHLVNHDLLGYWSEACPQIVLIGLIRRPIEVLKHFDDLRLVSALDGVNAFLKQLHFVLVGVARILLGQVQTLVVLFDEH